jgi:sorbitol-specific phosphotransferase system component IIBC
MNKQQSSTILMALAFIAATMLVSTVVVETLDLFDDAEAKKGDKTKESKKKSRRSD